MRMYSCWAFPVLLSAVRLALACADAETFRVATYNLEGYLDAPGHTRPAKSVEAKAKVRESIRALQPDVLAVQEIGSKKALLELQESLKSEGLELPYWDFVAGSDTNIHVAVLSRFPFTASRPHTNLSFLLGGRRYHVSRGYSEVDIQVNTGYAFTLITAHLKSRRAVPQADETELRLEEAKLLRQRVDALLMASASLNLVVLGDLNDTKDSESIKTIVGRGKNKLLDTRPAERNGHAVSDAVPAKEARDVTWTHYYSKDDTYSRIDYVLLSPGMAREWLAAGTYVLGIPKWGLASDHRPIVAEFEAQEK